MSAPVPLGGGRSWSRCSPDAPRSGFTARSGASTVEWVSATADMGQIEASVPPLVARRTFIDPGLQEQLSVEGCTRLPSISLEQVERLRSIFEEIFPERLEGFVPTYAVPMPERKAEATERVRAELGPVLSSLFDRHRIFNTSFLMKWPGDDSALPLHQDVSYVDERAFRTVVAWVALDDADEVIDNGPLQVVPGSHRWDRLPRGTSTWWPYGETHEFLTEHCLEALPVRRGDVLVMDNGLLHCSFPNRTDRPRLAVAVAFAPEEARLLHTVGNDDGTVNIYDVDEQFFIDDTPYTLMDHGMPERFRLREAGPVPVHAFTPSEVAELAGVPSPEIHDADAPAAPASVEPERPGRLTSLFERAVGSLMVVNNRLIARVDPLEPMMDPSSVGWTRTLEAAWETIRDEAAAALDARAVPLVEEVVGREQGNIGDWRTYVLVAHRQAVPANTALCPRTTELLGQVPGLQSALFSVFAPGTHLPAHQAPNRGVLRYHLGLMVPEPGTCRLRVGSRTVDYTEGQSILFDDVYEHEAWNSGTQPRVTLLLEVVRPLPVGARQVNALTQRAFGLYPEARGAVDRIDRINERLSAEAHADV